MKVRFEEKDGGCGCTVYEERQTGAAANDIAKATFAPKSRYPGGCMRSVNDESDMLVIGITGAVSLTLEKGTGQETVRVAAGDAVRIEKGTQYFWTNASEEPATVAMVCTPKWRPEQYRLVSP